MGWRRSSGGIEDRQGRDKGEGEIDIGERGGTWERGEGKGRTGERSKGRRRKAQQDRVVVQGKPAG